MNPQENEDDDAMEAQTLQVIESLIHSISHTQSFKGKWSLMETKLSDLKTQLSDVSDFPPNSISADLRHALFRTLSDALSLSLTCHSPNLPAGKLKTQNDVDSISAKLDNHIRDWEVITRSGVLHDDVVPSPVSRESVRVESRNLITRLQIGSGESRNSALDSLLRLIGEDDKNVIIAVAQGVVPVLVRLLDSGSSPEIIEKTVTAIARVSTINSSTKVLMAEGLLLLHYLIRVLDSGTGIAIEKACITLQALTLSKENATAIGSRGGISSLLEISQSGTPSSQAAAAAVLRNLAIFSDTRDNFMEEHAISVLLTLASSGTAMAQEYSISCLSNLVKEDDDMKLLIARKGGIGSLKNFWDSAIVGRSLEVAVEFLSNLASDQRLVEFIILNDFLNRLIIVLNCGVLGVRIHAAEAIFKIGYNTKTRKELGENGFIPPLIRMLDGKAIEEIEASSKALSTILIHPENRRIYRKEQKGIMSAVRLLDSSITNLDKKYAVSILMSLTHSMKCRKEMVKSGVLLHLQKLVEMDVEGAKKLQEVINGRKLWGVFKRSPRTP
ncbi:vacuolar protein 8-like [Cynara cardunculus var. scolymus]|uniref:Armadillo n=1 Tax=Cynara cardunculus var. scolymus TaxID=59895 RepID=A0A124SDV1_CYNCS|nr:vacuolar protein 8-like [Cynara cardunculus var. scolymus]KVH98127.1 Armadillo [Cynara cardunculus var. scolymus]